jgi:hypothetical protein
MNANVKWLLASWVCGILTCQVSFAEIDSTRQQRSSLIITPRFNTLNIAPVSGNIVNRHVNIDILMTYTNGRFTWMMQNGIDLEDSHSDMNYFLMNVRYKFSLTKNFGVSPFLAWYSEHAHDLIDPISDANGGVLFSYQHRFLTIEMFFLLVRVSHRFPEKDNINRLEIKCNLKPITISGFVYQNTAYFDGRERLAFGVKMVFPEIPFFWKVKARSEVMGSFLIHENPETSNVSGVFLSLAFPVNVK